MRDSKYLEQTPLWFHLVVVSPRGRRWVPVGGQYSLGAWRFSVRGYLLPQLTGNVTILRSNKDINTLTKRVIK